MENTYYKPTRKSTIQKYKRIEARYEELHNTQRKRIDDCIEQIMAEFFLDNADTVWRILKVAPDLILPEEKDTNQLPLF